MDRCSVQINTTDEKILKKLVMRQYFAQNFPQIGGWTIFWESFSKESVAGPNFGLLVKKLDCELKILFVDWKNGLWIENLDDGLKNCIMGQKNWWVKKGLSHMETLRHQFY